MAAGSERSPQLAGPRPMPVDGRNRRTRGTMRRTTVLTVAVTHPGWIGALKTLTLRPNKPPTVTTGCLAIGSTQRTRC